VVDLDDWAALGAGGPVRSRRLLDGCGVYAGQGESSSRHSWEAVGKQSRIGRSCASDSATNLHFYNGILRHRSLRLRKSAESGVVRHRLATDRRLDVRWDRCPKSPSPRGRDQWKPTTPFTRPASSGSAVRWQRLMSRCRRM
jgi:hypothetical protein